MKKKGYKLSSSETEVVSGIYSDQRFTKPKHQPVGIEYQSNGIPKEKHKLIGHINITIDLRKYDLNNSIISTVTQLKDDIEAQLEAAEIFSPMAIKNKEYKQSMADKRRKWEKEQREKYKQKLKEAEKDD